MDHIGKRVSITCAYDRGTFQGTILMANSTHLTIVKATCNGRPVDTVATQITIKASDILSLHMLDPNTSPPPDHLGDVTGESSPEHDVPQTRHEQERFDKYQRLFQQQQQQQPDTLLGHHQMYNAAAAASPAMLAPLADPDPGNGFEALIDAVQAVPNDRMMAATLAASNGPEMVALMMQSQHLTGPVDVPVGLGFTMTYPDTRRLPSPVFAGAKPAQQQRKQRQKSSSNAVSSAPVAANPAFGNLIPKQVEAMLHAIPSTSTSQSHVWKTPNSPARKQQQQQPQQFQQQQQPSTSSIAADVQQWPVVGQPQQQRVSSNRKTAAYSRNQAFSTAADDPLQLAEEFDFEGNLALFDKQAIWNEIDAIQKPEMMRQTAMVKPKNYRHDENILAALPAQSRQITGNGGANGGANGGNGGGIVVAAAAAAAMTTIAAEFTTDEGLVIPTVPLQQRNAIQMAAQSAGLTMRRQNDMLARGTAELALQLLGGARRLTPQNQHQWPLIVVLTDAGDWSELSAEVALATGRVLASHGLKVCVWGAADNNPVRADSIELGLFEACGGNVWHTGRVKDLPACDLVILSLNGALKGSIARWVNESRAPTLAIDPHVDAYPADHANPLGVCVKHSVLPVLPLNGITARHGGKLYLCNLGLPERFYLESGIRYRSPFGHKFVIPIHPLLAEERAAAAAGVALSV